MSRYLLAAALLLTACSGAPVPAGAAPVVNTPPASVLVGVAGAELAQAQATATAAWIVALAATDQAAHVTQAWGETQAALSVTATGQSLQMAADAATSTATAAHGNETATATALVPIKTQMAAPTQTAIAATIIADQSQRTRRELADIAYLVGRMAALVTLLYLAGRALSEQIRKQQLANDERAATVRRMQADALARENEARAKSVQRFGGVLVIIRANGDMEMHPLPGVLAAPAPEPRQIPVNVGGRQVSTIVMDPPESPELKRVLQLLDAAITVNGPDSNIVPGADDLGWHPQTWSNAVAPLKAANAVYTRQGRKSGGTFLYEYHHDLAELRRKVAAGEVRLDHSPTAEGAAAAPRSFQNVG